MFRLLSGGLIALLLTACSSGQQSENQDQVDQWYSQGDVVATAAQSQLLTKVKTALETGGPDYTIPFCHTNAGPIMDSLSQVFKCTIERISDRNRNPDQHPKSEEEAALMLAYVNRQVVGDTVLSNSGAPVFYRPIVIGLETCLKCHGQPGTDIAESTMGKLQELYPQDKATGYQMHDVRGLWKVTFPEDYE